VTPTGFIGCYAQKLFTNFVSQNNRDGYFDVKILCDYTSETGKMKASVAT